MDIPRINIEQQPTKIRLDIYEHKFALDKKQPQLEIDQKKGKLSIRQDTVKVNVDGYPHNYDLGYKNIRDRGREIAKEGNKTALKAIKDYAQEGDRLADIPSNTKEIAAQAKESSREEIEIGLEWKRGPEIEVIPHKLELEYEASFPETRAKMGYLNSQLSWGRVKVRIDQLYKTEISVSGGKLNRLF